MGFDIGMVRNIVASSLYEIWLESCAHVADFSYDV